MDLVANSIRLTITSVSTVRGTLRITILTNTLTMVIRLLTICGILWLII